MGSKPKLYFFVRFPPFSGSVAKRQSVLKKKNDENPQASVGAEKMKMGGREGKTDTCGDALSRRSLGVKQKASCRVELGSNLVELKKTN